MQLVRGFVQELASLFHIALTKRDQPGADCSADQTGGPGIVSRLFTHGGNPR